MLGESDLDTLIASMRPSLHPETFVFARRPNSKSVEELNPIMVFEESEGATLIIRQDVADVNDVDYQFPCRMITLEVHSALDAVGFIAAVSNRLSVESIGVNPVSGYFHDHLFVSLDKAERAMEVLEELSMH
jgi:hypothetical protein